MLIRGHEFLREVLGLLNSDIQVRAMVNARGAMALKRIVNLMLMQRRYENISGFNLRKNSAGTEKDKY